MSNSHTHSSPDYRNYPRSQQAYRRIRSLRITFSGPYVYSSGRQRHTSVDHPSSPVRQRDDEPYVSRQQGAITLQNNLPVASTGVHSELIRILHPRLTRFNDSLDDDLEDDVDDQMENEEDGMDDQTENEEDDMDDQAENEEDDQKENEEEVILEYFKTRTHRVAASKDRVNNPAETEEVVDREPADMCAICQAEFEHEETIGTLRCGHEYHTDCIKQWLLRKKDCPMCRASVFPFTRT